MRAQTMLVLLLLATIAVTPIVTHAQVGNREFMRDRVSDRLRGSDFAEGRFRLEGLATDVSLRQSEQAFRRLADSSIREAFALFGTRVLQLEGRVALDVSRMSMTIADNRVSIEPVTLRFHGFHQIDTDVGPQRPSFDQTGTVEFQAVPFVPDQPFSGQLIMTQQGQPFAGQWTASPADELGYRVSIAMQAGQPQALALKGMETAIHLARPEWVLRLVDAEPQPTDRPFDDGVVPNQPPTVTREEAGATGDELRTRVGEFLEQFRNKHPDLPEDAMGTGMVVGITRLSDGASVGEAVETASAAALQSLEPVQIHTELGLVTIQSPPATPNVRILAGENAHQWLIKNGFIRPDKTPLAPFHWFRSQLQSQGALPGDRLLSVGGDWNPTDPAVPLGYVTIMVRDPIPDDVADYVPDDPLSVDSSTESPADVGGTKLSPQQIQDIISWGVKHNRDPDDIRQDLREANESVGGSGEIPIDLSVTETPLGPVTATPEEGAEYERIRQRIDELQQEKAATRSRLAELEQRQRFWTQMSQNVTKRWAAGTVELMAERARLQNRLETIEKKYARPSVWDFPDSVDWRKAIEQWERTPEARGEISEQQRQEVADAHHAFVANIQHMTTKTPDHAQLTSWYNRHLAQLDEISRMQTAEMDNFRRQHAELTDLTEQRTRFEQRSLR